MNDSATRILDVAERRMRQSGYNAVSYRDIAAEIGVKSASLHYHFPKKEDLGVALVRRYAEALYTELAKTTADKSAPRDLIMCYVELFRAALKGQKLVCLCAVLGAEAPGLPPTVAAEVKTFFEDNIAWLKKVYRSAGADKPTQKAKTVLSLLEGAMIVSSASGDVSAFDAAVRCILDDVVLNAT